MEYLVPATAIATTPLNTVGKCASLLTSVKLAKAISCSINKGVLDKKGVVQTHPARIFVDNSLLLAISRLLMEMALAALIEAIFVIKGEPNTAIQQCPLALDKWVEMVVGPIQTMLGLNLDTNKLIVAIPGSYVEEVLLDSSGSPETARGYEKTLESRKRLSASDSLGARSPSKTTTQMLTQQSKQRALLAMCT